MCLCTSGLAFVSAVTGHRSQRDGVSFRRAPGRGEIYGAQKRYSYFQVTVIVNHVSRFAFVYVKIIDFVRSLVTH